MTRCLWCSFAPPFDPCIFDGLHRIDHNGHLSVDPVISHPATKKTRGISSPAGKPAQELSGTIERIRFTSAHNGWSVLELRIENGSTMPVVGIAPGAAPGEQVRCRGEWIIDPRYGRQFRADHIVSAPPATADAIERYLASGIIAGIGATYAKRLVSMFGTELPRIIETNPSYLDAVEGIGPARRQRIVQSWHQQRGGRDVQVFLNELGIGAQRAAQIRERYGDNTINVIRANPYRLAADIAGIGFSTADEIAKGCGIGPEDPKRIEAGLREILHRHLREGHCAVEETILIQQTNRLLRISSTPITASLNASLQGRRLVRDILGERTLIYTPALREAEIAFAAHIHRLCVGPPPWGVLDTQTEIDKAERVIGLTLSPSQRQGLARLLQHKCAVVTGGPGTGKSTLVRFLLCIVETRIRSISLAAPLGRVARALKRSTGHEASTLYRLLRGTPGSDEFARNADDPLDAQLLWIDEMSLVDLRMALATLEAVPDECAVIFQGDHEQLGSIRPGDVLRDLIASGVVPVIHLTEVHRQGKNSNITYNADRIKRGLPPLIDEERLPDFEWIIENDVRAIAGRVVERVAVELPSLHSFNFSRDIQVLTPMKRGELGVRRLNAHLQHELNPQPTHQIVVNGIRYGVGDRVMQTENNIMVDVYNGETGYIEAINEAARSITIDFEGQRVSYGFDELHQVQLGYVTTPHKAQGSEFPSVVMVLTLEHYILLNKPLLFSAITRGRRYVTLIGQEAALRAALRAARGLKRSTGLRERLLGQSMLDSAPRLDRARRLTR